MPLPTSPISRRCIGRSAREVGVDLRHRPALVAGGLERQRGDPAPRELARVAERDRSPRTASCPAPARASAAWWTISSSKASRSRALSASCRRVGKVHRPQRVGDAGKPAADPQLRRQRLGRAGGELGGLRDPLSNPVRAQALGGRVHRHEADRVQAKLLVRRRGIRTRFADDLVGLDPKPRAVELAAQQQMRPRGESLDQPRLVEPHRLQRPGGVADLRLDDPQPTPAGRTHAGRLDLDQHRRLLVDAKLRHLTDVGVVAVAVREVPEQVADRLETHLRRGGGELRPRPAQRGQRNRQLARTRGRARLGEAQRLGIEWLAGPDRPRGRRRGLGARDGGLADHEVRLGCAGDGTDRGEAGGARARAAAAVRSPTGSRVSLRPRAAQRRPRLRLRSPAGRRIRGADACGGRGGADGRGGLRGALASPPSRSSPRCGPSSATSTA